MPVPGYRLGILRLPTRYSYLVSVVWLPLVLFERVFEEDHCEVFSIMQAMTNMDTQFHVKSFFYDEFEVAVAFSCLILKYQVIYLIRPLTFFIITPHTESSQFSPTKVF